jgi:hypothetical protein
MGDPASNPTQTNLRVEAVRAVQHIPDQGALDLWMDEQVGLRRQDHNTRRCPLLLNMGYGNQHKEHRTLHQLLGHYTRNVVKAEWVWNGMGV